MQTSAQRLADIGVGSRVVVRYRIGDLATDVLGVLLALGPRECTIDTRKGPVVVAYDVILAAKQIPPPPPPRIRRP